MSTKLHSNDEASRLYDEFYARNRENRVLVDGEGIRLPAFWDAARLYVEGRLEKKDESEKTEGTR